MIKTRLLILLLLALALILTACNPKQATPPVIDTNLVTEAPVANYNGDDETVYFLVEEPDGTQTRFEAGFIKDGKLTLNPEDPPAELQRPWIDTLPANAGDLEYSDAAETAMTVHVTALLIGDTGLMITGTSGLTPSSGVPAEMTGLTWTNSHFQASWYLPARPDLPGGMHLDAAYDGWVAYGATGPNQSTTMDPANFYFDITHYISHDATSPGLPHPFHYPTQPFPETPETPGDEDPDEPGNDNPEDPETPSDPDPEATEPAEVKAVITSPVNGTASVDEPITFSAEGSTGEGELTFEWSLGNGSDPISTTDLTISASYPIPGEYTFTLKVTDEANQPATATGTITVIDPNIVTHQVQNYTGDEAPIGIPVLVPDAGLESLVMGTITGTGLITVDFSTPVPDEYLMQIDYNFPDGSYSQADVNFLFAVEGLAFIAGETPEPGDPIPAFFVAMNRADYPSNPGFNEGDALGFYMYTDEAVNILVTPDMAPGATADLSLIAGWNFVSMQSTATGMHLTNADPADYYWFEMVPEPEPEIVGISFDPEESEWFANPATPPRKPTVYVEFDHGDDTWFNPEVFGSLTWSSNNPSVATVSTDGEIFAHSYGTAIITAHYNGFEAEFTVIVNTVELENPPLTPVDVYAQHPIGTTGNSVNYRVGIIDAYGLFTFNNQRPTLSPITDNAVIDASFADNQDVNLAFMGFLTTDDHGTLWIGGPMNQDGTFIDDNSFGKLWYSDDHVNITGTNEATGDTYDLSLIPGWNLIVMTASNDEGSTGFHYANAPMNGLLDWQYEEPTALIIETTRDGNFIEVNPYFIYPSSRTPTHRAYLLVYTSNAEVASIAVGNNIEIKGIGTATVSFIHPTAKLPTTTLTLTITDFVPH